MYQGPNLQTENIIGLHIRLKQLRLHYQMTQRQVADIMGVERSTYTYYELGKSKPNIELIVKLAQLYNVSTDYLLGYHLGDLDYTNQPAHCK